MYHVGKDAGFIWAVFGENEANSIQTSERMTVGTKVIQTEDRAGLASGEVGKPLPDLCPTELPEIGRLDARFSSLIEKHRQSVAL